MNAAQRSARKFQSAPGGGAGGNLFFVGHQHRFGEFQSAPGGGAGGNGLACNKKFTTKEVSIRPRRWGRGKLKPVPFVFGRVLFQSAPGGGAGGNEGPSTGPVAWFSFNPPPAVGPGETQADRQSRPVPRRFNPPPAVGPGETIA